MRYALIHVHLEIQPCLLQQRDRLIIVLVIHLVELEVELPGRDRLRHLPTLRGQSDPQLNYLTPVDVLSDVFIVALLMLPSLAGLSVYQDTGEFGVERDDIVALVDQTRQLFEFIEEIHHPNISDGSC